MYVTKAIKEHNINSLVDLEGHIYKCLVDSYGTGVFIFMKNSKKYYELDFQSSLDLSNPNNPVRCTFSSSNDEGRYYIELFDTKWGHYTLSTFPFQRIFSDVIQTVGTDVDYFEYYVKVDYKF